jgi:hypothetical protein
MIKHNSRRGKAMVLPEGTSVTVGGITGKLTINLILPAMKILL